MKIAQGVIVVVLFAALAVGVLFGFHRIEQRIESGAAWVERLDAFVDRCNRSGGFVLPQPRGRYVCSRIDGSIEPLKV